MEKESAKQVIAFELEATCPDSVDVERCADEIADKLGDGFAPNFRRVRSIVREGLQTLESCLVEAEMEQIAGEISELLCVECEDGEDEDEDFLDLDLQEDEDDE